MNELHLAQLATVVRWCVLNDGECMGDHPMILKQAKAALAAISTPLSESGEISANAETVNFDWPRKPYAPTDKESSDKYERLKRLHYAVQKFAPQFGLDWVDEWSAIPQAEKDCLVASINEVFGPCSAGEGRNEPTEEMADAVRGVLQILRGKNGATFLDVYEHCRNRGEDMRKWPQWARDSVGYVSERAAACLIYELMQAHAPADTRSAIKGRE